MTARRLGAEALGTAMLLVAVVGSGVAASVDGPASAQLFQHAVAVGVALTALILTFGPVSGAHLNPAVTLVDAAFCGLGWRLASGYVVAQVVGATAGTVLANLLFGLPAIAVGTTVRSGGPVLASEAFATFGLLVVIFGTVRGENARAVAVAVGAWIIGAITFTSSASFANPAVTVARSLTDSYTGIVPSGILPFVAAQLLGAAAAFVVVRWLFAPDPASAGHVVVPRTDRDTAIDSTTGSTR